MIRIRKIEQLRNPYHVIAGDTFRLYVDGECVHSVDIVETGVRRITHWACFEIGDSGVAYAVGDENLEPDLRRLTG